MSIPYDQRIAKLRILIRRADAFYAAQKRVYDDVVKQAYEPVYRASEDRVRLFSQYMQIARELGYCGTCEKPSDECRCVWLAKANGSA